MTVKSRYSKSQKCNRNLNSTVETETDIPFHLQFEHMFERYPHLLDQKTLISNYPWSEGRITYNYILTSYRKPNHSIWSCLLGLFTVHNELVNAWTHIFGAVLAFLTLVISLVYCRSPMSQLVHFVFCIGGLFMFSSSVSFHVFCCHSDMMCRSVQCLDWLGISVKLFGSNLLVAYYELEEFPYLFNIVTLINLSFAIIVYTITYSALHVSYNPHEKVTVHTGLVGHLMAVVETYAFRTLVSMTYGCGALLVLFLSYFMNDYHVSDRIWPVLSIYCCFGTVILCLLDLPEKWMTPGSLDILGNSHQIFHLGIIAGYFLIWWSYFQFELVR